MTLGLESDTPAGTEKIESGGKRAERKVNDYTKQGRLYKRLMNPPRRSNI